MKKILFMLFAIALSGCANQPTQLTQFKYETWEVPQEMTVIPSYTYIDVTKSTQKDASMWIIDSEKRMQFLEEEIKQIRILSDTKKAEIANKGK